jgi:hypothetical protein
MEPVYVRRVLDAMHGRGNMNIEGFSENKVAQAHDRVGILETAQRLKLCNAVGYVFAP